METSNIPNRYSTFKMMPDYINNSRFGETSNFKIMNLAFIKNYLILYFHLQTQNLIKILKIVLKLSLNAD